VTQNTDGRRARGLATRQKVLAAASELFSGDGYSATSTAAIAKAAGVRVASIYHQFESKEILLAAVLEQAADGFFATLPNTRTHPAGLWGALAAVADSFAARPEFLRLLLLLAVERRQGDPEILRTAVGVRTRARAWLGDGLRPYIADLSVTQQDEVTRRMSRLIVMMLDGAFVARQLDASYDEIPELFDVLVIAARAALPEIVDQVSNNKKGLNDE
jgi:AcrR family transcriptional regulator